MRDVDAEIARCDKGAGARPLVRIRPGFEPKPAGTPRGILFDRDGTLIEDVPYNGDPAKVTTMPTALAAVAVARKAGLYCGVVSNQSGIDRGLLTAAAAWQVADEVDRLFGVFDVWVLCPHVPGRCCRCRKPGPGGLLTACTELGLAPTEVGYIGDIGADLEAARAAGIPAVMVPTRMTRSAEVAAALRREPNLLAAVRDLLTQIR